MAEEVGAAPQGAVRACGRKEKQIVLARTRSGHHLPVLTLIICLPSPKVLWLLPGGVWLGRAGYNAKVSFTCFILTWDLHH